MLQLSQLCTYASKTNLEECVTSKHPAEAVETAMSKQYSLITPWNGLGWRWAFFFCERK